MKATSALVKLIKAAFLQLLEWLEGNSAAQRPLFSASTTTRVTLGSDYLVSQAEIWETNQILLLSGS